MGMTFWIHTLEGRDYSKDSDDYSLLSRHVEAIDVLCEKLGVPVMSSFVDYTDLEFNYEERDEDGEPELDPETGFAYGIDDMKWFSATEGLKSFLAIRDSLKNSPLSGLSAERTSELIEELESCIQILEGPASRAGKFHLSLLE